MELAYLDDDILVLIVSLLSPLDIVSLRLVCRFKLLESDADRHAHYENYSVDQNICTVPLC